MRVLVIDPAPGTRRDVADPLRSDGHVVIEADSVEAAWTTLNDSPVDLVVCDEYLPGRGGISLSRAITCQLQIPCVAVEDTAVTLAGALVSSSARERLTKPVATGRLRAAVRRAATGRRDLGAAAVAH